MSNKRLMKYRDEMDKSYGIAGMALGLSVFDAADLFTSITLDGNGEGAIKFTPEFFFAGNPRLSPRGAWQYILGHYRISVGLAVANALCRRMVLDNERADKQLREQLFDAACADGAVCLNGDIRGQRADIVGELQVFFPDVNDERTA